MLLTLEPLQALEGDCLLLHWGSVADPRLAVIDGGPGNVYQNSLRPRLEEIRANRGLERLPIELVMVSHVDNDHIVGVKKFFQQLKHEVDGNVGAALRHFGVKRLWHNTFNDVLGDGIDKYYTTLTASLQASVGGSPNPELVKRLADAYKTKHPAALDPDAEALDIALVLAGHGEGRGLRDSWQFLFNHGQTAALNAPFTKNGQSTLITREMTPTPVSIGGLGVTIIGPMEAEIEALQEEFDTFITQKGLVEASLLAAYADTSIKNLSSIVCLVEIGGKRILLTGDARGDKILDGLQAVGLLAGGPLKVDVLKGPHHGSDRNVEPEFFEQIIADTYVFSGDGKHGNPERDTLTWLTDGRGKDAEFKIVLTYPVAEIDPKRRHEAEKRHKPWTKAKHSLDAFFEKRKDEGFKFTVHEGAPIKIDLGDETPPW
jgi:hypothetical protein